MNAERYALRMKRLVCYFCLSAKRVRPIRFGYLTFDVPCCSRCRS